MCVMDGILRGIENGVERGRSLRFGALGRRLRWGGARCGGTRLKSRLRPLSGFVRICLGGIAGVVWTHGQSPRDTALAPLQLSETGATSVVGRFEVENPYVTVDWEIDPEHAWARSVLPDPPQSVNTVPALRAWRNRPDIAAQFTKSRRYPLIFSADGSFRMDDVLPGKYQVAFRIHDPRVGRIGVQDRYVATVSHAFRIPGGVARASSEPIDLGVISVRLAPDSLEGMTMAPTFQVPDARGGVVDLVAHQGKFVLLGFWATWCAPCLTDLPYIRAVHERYADRNDFVVISLSLDEQMIMIDHFLKQNEAPWLQGFVGPRDQSPIPKQYGVKDVPTMFLIDPEGKIVAEGMTGKGIEIEVARFLDRR